MCFEGFQSFCFNFSRLLAAGTSVFADLTIPGCSVEHGMTYALCSIAKTMELAILLMDSLFAIVPRDLRGRDAKRFYNRQLLNIPVHVGTLLRYLVVKHIFRPYIKLFNAL